MKLTFCGKSPQQRFFRIGVVGNNLADDLTMIIDKKQGNLNLAEFTPYLRRLLRLSTAILRSSIKRDILFSTSIPTPKR